MQGQYRSENGRIINVEQVNSHRWDAWFDDDHSVIYSQKTKKAVLEEIAGDA